MPVLFDVSLPSLFLFIPFVIFFILSFLILVTPDSSYRNYISVPEDGWGVCGVTMACTRCLICLDHDYGA